MHVLLLVYISLIYKFFAPLFWARVFNVSASFYTFALCFHWTYMVQLYSLKANEHSILRIARLSNDISNGD